MGKYTQFLLRIDPQMLSKIESVSRNGKTSEQIRKMLREWLNINHPDEELIDIKIHELRTEILKLEEFKKNAGLFKIKVQQELQNIEEFRNDKLDGVMTMLYVQFISNQGDDEYYRKWKINLKFSTKIELLDYLEDKWVEYGLDGVLGYRHRQAFNQDRMNQIWRKAKYDKMNVEDYMNVHNIDLDNEYNSGELKGSCKDYEVYKSRVGSNTAL